MADFNSDGNWEIKLRPIEEHRINMKRTMKALPELDPNPHDLVKMLFSEDEREWLRKNLRT
jgi:hypothetical protein